MENGPNTLLCGTPNTTLTSLLRQPSTVTCCDQYDKNSVNIGNTEQSLKKISRWLTLSKAAAEINLHDPSFLPAHSLMHFAVYGHSQKCITGSQTFPISKLCGLKHTTSFHKSSETNRHQKHKQLRQYWRYRNGSEIGSRGGRWNFRNMGDIGLSSTSGKTTQTNKAQKHYT